MSALFLFSGVLMVLPANDSAFTPRKSTPLDLSGAVASDPVIESIIDQIIQPAAVVDIEARILEGQLAALAQQIKVDFQAAYQHKMTTGIARALREDARLVKGEYTPQQLAAIREIGGSEKYFNLLATKCESGEAWVDDQLGPETYKPELEPTPLSELPAEEQTRIDAMVADQQAQVVVFGEPQDSQELRQKLESDRRAQIHAEAEKRAKAMTEKIQDQYQEGGFDHAYKDFIHNLWTFKAAFLKGPEIRMQKRAVWGPDGLDVKTEEIQTWRAPAPDDIYPAPNAATLEDGPLCETVCYTRAGLEEMIGSLGWHESEIIAVLAEAPVDNPRAYLPEELTRAQDENRDTTINQGLAPGNFCAIEYWAEARDGTPYEVGQEIRAILIGNHVVYDQPNPHPLGRRMYRCTSFKKTPGTVWGISLPEKGAAIQEAAAACARNLIDDLALSAGDIMAADADAIDYEDRPKYLKPKSILYFHSSRLRNASTDPVKFFQHTSSAEKLQSCYAFFADMMDDATGIPRYVQGNGDIKGAGQTASGMSMLMSAAGKVLRSILSNIQCDVLDPMLEDIYLWNLMYLDDVKYGYLKGDCRVKPIGPLQVMSRELDDMRRTEMLAATNNAVDMAIIGQSGRAAQLRYQFERLSMNDVVPTKEEMDAFEEAQNAQAQAQAEAQAQAQAVAQAAMLAGGKGAPGKPGKAAQGTSPIPMESVNQPAPAAAMMQMGGTG